MRAISSWLTPRSLVILWMLGFVCAFVVQTAFQSWFAAETLWGANRGWQTEIALWNLGVLVILVGVLRADRGVEAHVLPGLVLLAVCFGINHALAALASPGSLSHWGGAALNGAGVLVYGVYRLTDGGGGWRGGVILPAEPGPGVGTRAERAEDPGRRPGGSVPVETFAELLARLEGHDPAGGDLEGLAGDGVPALAGLLLPDPEHAESRELDLVAPFERLLDQLEDVLDELGRLDEREPGLFVDQRGQILLGHGHVPPEPVAPGPPPRPILHEEGAPAKGP